MDDLVDRERPGSTANPPAAATPMPMPPPTTCSAPTARWPPPAIAWSDASGLDVLAALGDLYDAVEAAATEAGDLGRALEGVSCPA